MTQVPSVEAEMGQDIHFLERLERVSVVHAERSLALYHDHALVNALLRAEKVAASTERVALALDVGLEPPYVVVAGNGHFVTCLGAGMKPTGLRILPWPRVEQGMREFRASIVASELSHSGHLEPLFNRVFSGMGDVTREDIGQHVAVMPILFDGAYQSWLKLFMTIFRRVGTVQRRHQKDRATPEELRGVWMHRWALAHCAVALVAGDPGGFKLERLDGRDAFSDFALTVEGVLGGYMPTAARLVWATSQLGPKGAAALFQSRLEAEQPGQAGMASLALSTLALKHPELLEQVRSTLRKPLLKGPFDHPGTSWEDVNRTEARLVGVLEAPVRSWEAFKSTAAAWAHGRLSAAFGEEANHFDADDLLALALNVAAPGKNDAAWLESLVGFVPALARASAIQLYLPSRWMTRVAFDPSWVETLLGRSAWILREPVRAEPRQGRNELCACGSGKKSKRCCAA